MRITLVSGADGAPFAHSLAAALDPADELVVVAPTVRGHFSAGLLASPDLDALLSSPSAPRTYAVADALAAVGYVPGWQRSDDLAVAARLIRTDLVAAGASLTDATLAAAIRAGLPYRLLPACDERAELRVVIGGDEPRAVHVEEYLADPGALSPDQLLLVAEAPAVSAAVAEALRSTDVLVLGPSSRTLAIDPVLRTPGFVDLVPGTLPVLVVEHADTAPTDLVRVAGLREADPGRARAVPADPAAVVAQAREAVA